MALLNIARMGHPVLRTVAAPIPDPTDPAVRRLAADMTETMLDAPGVGLAAPQIHESVRMLVFRIPPDRSGGEAIGNSVLINPILEPLGEEMEMGWEGCLSIPGLRGLVPRYTRIRYAGVGLDGEPVERIADGFHARVIQHEYDHLNGILYIDRMPDLRLLAFNEESQYIADALREASRQG